MLRRHATNTVYCEAVAKSPDLNRDMDDEMADYLALTSLHSDANKDSNGVAYNFNYGLDYKHWSTPEPEIVRGVDTEPGQCWLMNQVAEPEDEQIELLDIPVMVDSDGVIHHYDLEHLMEDQKEIAASVLSALRRFVLHDVDKDGVFKQTFQGCSIFAQLQCEGHQVLS